MLAELASVMNAVPPNGSRKEYVSAVIDANCLRKPTISTRRLSLQRLSELYALDPEIPIFRILRLLWDADPVSRPQLAILAALARDPLLMATAQAIVPLAEGLEMPRKSMTEGLREKVGDRLSEYHSGQGHSEYGEFLEPIRPSEWPDLQDSPKNTADTQSSRIRSLSRGGFRFPWGGTPRVWLDQDARLQPLSSSESCRRGEAAWTIRSASRW